MSPNYTDGTIYLKFYAVKQPVLTVEKRWMQKPNLIILVLFSFDFVYLMADLGSNVYTNECVNVLLKVKLEESALINVNKNRCPLQINTLRYGVNWYALLSK